MKKSIMKKLLEKLYGIGSAVIFTGIANIISKTGSMNYINDIVIGKHEENIAVVAVMRRKSFTSNAPHTLQKLTDTKCNLNRKHWRSTRYRLR